jgi:hypothetical protein
MSQPIFSNKNYDKFIALSSRTSFKFPKKRKFELENNEKNSALTTIMNRKSIQ